MKNKYNHLSQYAVLVSLAIALILLFFGKIALQPNSYIFGQGGDGIKNYFTPAYYLKHDMGWEFTGMNYPYSEHVVFTDNQPIVAAALNFIDDHLFTISHYTIGILNVLMLLSLLFSIVIVFSILKHYYLPSWYAIPAALIIGFFTPQIFRFPAHYALAYGLVVPAIWWSLIKINTNKRRSLYQVLLVLFGAVIAWVHVYYVMIYAVFIAAYYTVGALYRVKDKGAALRYWGMGMAIALLPMLIFQIILFLTDTITDRPESPYGIFAYTTSFESVFLPIEGPFLSLWNYFIKVAAAKAEGYAYIGIVGFVVFIFTFFKMGHFVYKRQWKQVLRPVLPRDLAQMFWASILVLVFAMGLPFKIMPFILDLIPPLKQFRSLGRFAWVFYYVFTVYAAVYIFILYRKLRQKQLYSFANWLLVLVLLLYSVEGFMQVKNRVKSLKKGNYGWVIFGKNTGYLDALKKANVSVDDFQAILPLPFYSIGSEKFYIETGNTVVVESFRAAYQTGLPLASGMMSRTSLAQSLKLVQLLSNEYIDKEIIADYPSQKPLLLLVTNNKLTPEEEALVKKATPVGNEGNISLYRLELSAFESKGKEIIAQFEAEKDSTLLTQNAFKVSEEGAVIHFDAFDRGQATDFGVETLKAGHGKVMLFNKKIDPAWVGKPLRVSLWLNAAGKSPAFPVFKYEQKDKAGKQVKYTAITAKYTNNVYKNWALVEHDFTLEAADNTIELTVEGKDIDIESLLIQKKGADVYLPLPLLDKKLMYNNYYFEYP